MNTSAESYNNSGLTLAAQGKFAEAAIAFRQALGINPNDAGVLSNLANALRFQGKNAEAIESYRHALRLQPHDASGHFLLGNYLFEQRQLAESVACYQEALRLNPAHADACNNLGTALFELGNSDDARAYFRRSLHLNPEDADVHVNLGNVARAQGALDEAIASFQEALRVNPEHAEAHNSLGNSFKDQGRPTEALACYRNALKLAPQNPGYASNYLLTLNYAPGSDAPTIFAELRRWERGIPALGKRVFTNDKMPERRLRIGYVSPDFRDHVVGRNVWPLLRCHDHRQFDITLYSQSAKSDEMTERFRNCADHWCPIFGWSDNQVVDRVRQDKIDILVDLALHTSNNRLLVFAAKPAPLQVTFAGYPGSTGLSAIDYRLTDPYLDPPGLLDAFYAETSYRLPHSFWCYDPGTDQPHVAPLPAVEKGLITFGCLNNFCKVNDAVLEIWARVLTTVPGSCLLLLAKQGSHRQRTLAYLARHGVADSRVLFNDLRPRQHYLALYHQIDIGLDTFPYNGHTTSLDSFWMGVPVVTLVGNTVVGRGGLSQLTNLGLQCYAAATPEDFVGLAKELAGDVPKLKELRQGLRLRIKNSPLVDAAGFTRGIENAYRSMWRKWCTV
jgi:protein O-GlcNAc transferase